MSNYNLNQNLLFQNTNGNKILLTINHYDSQKMSVEFMVTHTNSKKIFKIFTLLFLLISTNIYSFYFRYFHIYYNIILSLVILGFIVKIVSTVTRGGYFNASYISWIHSNFFPEKVLLVKSLGLQITVTYCTGLQSCIFIPWKNIEKVFINEVITLVSLF